MRLILDYDVQVISKDGLTVRKCIELVQGLSKIGGEFTITKGNSTVDAKSILGLMSLVLREKEKVRFMAIVEKRKKDELNDFISNLFDVIVLEIHARD
jgi:phosphotransferase system HPr (HPr) family protein